LQRIGHRPFEPRRQTYEGREEKAFHTLCSSQSAKARKPMIELFVHAAIMPFQPASINCRMEMAQAINKED
jgi:hypothetical protein